MHRSNFAAFTITFLALLLADMANAQCSDASKLKLDVCSVAECQARQSKVHLTCDVPGGRSCKQGKLAQDELERRLNINLRCKAVRQSVADCYKESHGGHIDQINNAQTSIDECLYQAGQGRRR